MFILNTKIDVFNRNFDASPTRIVLKSKDGIGMAIYYLLTHIVLKKSHYAVLQKINDEDTEKNVYSISREKNGEVAFDFVKEEKIKKAVFAECDTLKARKDLAESLRLKNNMDFNLI